MILDQSLGAEEEAEKFQETRKRVEVEVQEDSNAEFQLGWGGR